MPSLFTSAGLRSRVLASRAMARLGLGENAILLPLALIVGIVTGAAAVGFHELINLLRDLLYRHFFTPGFLYGPGVPLLIVLPAAGGLVVGLTAVYVFRSREGHGVVDVMESVMRNSGVIKPASAIEKILTSAITIGSGGSAGAEGPIVQIGAAIASGVGILFQVARAQLPVLIGCGCAAGVSAIFNSPIGGVLFTLEIILLDFSVTAFAPVVLASVISNVTARAILLHIDPNSGPAIFQVPPAIVPAVSLLQWGSIPYFVLLGLICGLAGVSLTRLMYWMDERFHRLPIARAIRPAVGGAALGVIGVIYVVGFGWGFLHQAKPIDFKHYPMPAFYGDGYGAVQQLFDPAFYSQFEPHFWHFILLLLFLCLAKIVGSCLTLGSGGSGGVIAPSLFLGGTTGALTGILLHHFHLSESISPALYALIGMGAVLSAVVHAPLASILILVEVTDRHNIILPAMLATVSATGTARLIFPDSVYTLTLRQRGVRMGSGADLSILRRRIVEQVPLEPVTAIPTTAPFERLAELEESTGATDFVATDADGNYAGMVVAADIQTTLLQRDAIPLLLVRDLMRQELPCVQITDDLASVMEIFSRYEVGRLPVCLKGRPGRVVGLISRRALMNEYHQALSAN
jgi:CIC family chloride channel protein